MTPTTLNYQPPPAPPRPPLTQPQFHHHLLPFARYNHSMLTRSLILVLLILLPSCDSNSIPSSNWSALQSAEKYELLSLQPLRSQSPDADTFYGNPILGRLQITDPALRKTLNDALRKSVQDSDGSVAACFNPRHGIRLTQDSRTTDFLICFECYSAKIYTDGHFKSSFLLTPSAQPTFDAALTAAKIPLATK